MPQERIAMLGVQHFAGVRCVSWLDDIPNLADFDVVVVDTNSLADLYQALHQLSDEKKSTISSRLYSNFHTIRTRLIHLLNSKGRLIVVCRPYAHLRTSDRSSLGLYEWCPIPIHLVSESGATIELTEDVGILARYLSLMRSWQFYFSKKYDRGMDLYHLAEFYEGTPHITLSEVTFAQNRYQQPLAMALQYSLHQVAPRHDIGWEELEGRAYYNPKPFQISGRTFLLPTPTTVSAIEGLQILLEDMFDWDQHTHPPDWAASITVSGAELLKSKLGDAQGQLAALRDDVGKLEMALEELDRWKELLYETGHRLQSRVGEAFKLFGAEILPSVVSDEFIIKWNDERLLVEVKGNQKGIAEADLAQLMKDLSNHFAETTEDIGGLLVGNAWRLLALDERERGATVTFPPNVVRTARNRRVKLLSTTDLFAAVCRVLDDKTNGTGVLGSVFHATEADKDPTVLLR